MSGAYSVDLQERVVAAVVKGCCLPDRRQRSSELARPSASEHGVWVGGLFGNDLQHVPVLYDFSVLIDPEDIGSRPRMVPRPLLPTMQDYVVAFGDDPKDLDFLAGVLAGRFLEVVDETLLAVADARIVLDILGSRVLLDRLARLALIEHQVIEGGDLMFVAL